MRPPQCELCEARFDPSGSDQLVRFASRPEDVAWRQRMEASGGVGHPPDTAWFCPAHVAAARALAHLTLPEALQQLRSPPPTVTVPLRPCEPRALMTQLLMLAPQLAISLGAAPLPHLEQTTDRRWSPMDNCLPPYCPFTDTSTWVGQREGLAVFGQLVVNCWNEQEVANASVTLTLHKAGSAAWSLRAHAEGATVSTATVTGPHAAATAAVLAGLA